MTITNSDIATQRAKIAKENLNVANARRTNANALAVVNATNKTRLDTAMAIKQTAEDDLQVMIAQKQADDAQDVADAVEQAEENA